MIIVPYFNDPESGDRTHPWAATEYGDEQNGGGRYVDYKEFPDEIPKTLEDFIPFECQQAVQHFYAFMAWINGPDSHLETNDCAFRGPHPNEDSIFQKKMKFDGRVELFARNYMHNVDPNTFCWLQRMLFIYLQLDRPGFRGGLLSMSAKDTTYVALPAAANQGKRISLIFNAYGNDEPELFENLFIIFDVIWESCKQVSHALLGDLPRLPD